MKTSNQVFAEIGPRPEPTNTARFEFVFLLGVPHCGSTLLGMMLNSHPDIGCLGETALVGRAVEVGRPCSCGLQIRDCPFWQPLLPILKPKDRKDYRRHTPGMYTQIRTTLGKQVLVDLSKALAWRMTRGFFSPWKQAQAGFIFLVRDTRAVVSSRLPPHHDELMKVLAQHKKWMLRFARFSDRLGDRNLTVHYEDLCTNPEIEMKRICAWMRVPFHDSMLDPYGQSNKHHFVHSSHTSYTKHSRALKLDERWRSRVDAQTQATIESVMREIPIQAERYLTDAV
jgi:hypothetical protein